VAVEASIASTSIVHGRWASEPTLAAGSTNPSFLALHPSGRFLYAVNELQDFQASRREP